MCENCIEELTSQGYHVLEQGEWESIKEDLKKIEELSKSVM